MIEEADIVGDWSRPSPSTSPSPDDRHPRRRPAGRVRRGRPPDRCDAAVHPEYRGRGIGTALAALDAGQRPRARVRGDRDAGARRARPATGCSRRSATGSAGPAGGSSCSKAPTIPERAAPRGVRRPRGRPGGVPSRSGRSRRTPSSNGPVRDRRDVRGLAGRGDAAGPASSRGRSGSSRTRPVRSSAIANVHDLPARPRRRLHRRGSRPGKDQRHRGLAQALLVDAFAAGTRARRCDVRACPPTPGPARSASTRRSAWWSPPTGSTAAALTTPRRVNPCPRGSPAGRSPSRTPPP